MKGDWSIIEPRDLLRQSLPGDSPQNGVVRPSRICHGDSPLLDAQLTLSFDEISIEFRGIARFKPSEVLSQSAVKRVSDHRHDDVEVDFDQDG